MAYRKMEDEEIELLLNLLNQIVKEYNSAGELPRELEQILGENSNIKQVLDRAVKCYEDQLMERGALLDTCKECGCLWDSIFNHCSENDDWVKEKLILFEDINYKIQKNSRKYFYLQGIIDALWIMKFKKSE